MAAAVHAGEWLTRDRKASQTWWTAYIYFTLRKFVLPPASSCRPSPVLPTWFLGGMQGIHLGTREKLLSTLITPLFISRNAEIIQYPQKQPWFWKSYWKSLVSRKHERNPPRNQGEAAFHTDYTNDFQKCWDCPTFSKTTLISGNPTGNHWFLESMQGIHPETNDFLHDFFEVSGNQWNHWFPPWLQYSFPEITPVLISQEITFNQPGNALQHSDDVFESPLYRLFFVRLKRVLIFNNKQAL